MTCQDTPLNCMVWIDPRETSSKSQEFRHLDSLRLPFRYAQHVQGVPRDVQDRRSGGIVPRHGCETSCSIPVDSRRLFLYNPCPCTTTANVLEQILKVIELEKQSDVKRPYILQVIKAGLKFPLPHRVPKQSNKKIFAPSRPSTFF